MKILRLTLLTWPLLLAACSSDSADVAAGDSSSAAIRFHSSLQGMTRSTYKSDLSNLTAFKVAAVSQVDPPSVYFTPMEVTHESDGSWKSSITYYWPPQPLNFYAYAPTDLPVTITGAAQQLAGYTTASKAADQQDIITAWGYGVRAQAPETNGPVALNFRHALCQVEIRASNPSDTRIAVLGVKLCRIPSTGTMSIQQNADDAPTWVTDKNSEQDYVIKGNRSVAASDKRALVIMQNSATVHSLMFGQDGWLMIPQTLSPWTAGPKADGAYISVLCQINDGSGRQLYPSEEGKFGYTSVPINTTWLPGRRYIYTLNFFADGGSAGLIDPNPTSPDDPNHEDEDIDITPGGDRQGGDIVVNSPITFTVEITDWQSNGVDNTSIGF